MARQAVVRDLIESQPAPQNQIMPTENGLNLDPSLARRKTELFVRAREARLLAWLRSFLLEEVSAASVLLEGKRHDLMIEFWKPEFIGGVEERRWHPSFGVVAFPEDGYEDPAATGRDIAQIEIRSLSANRLQVILTPLEKCAVPVLRLTTEEIRRVWSLDMTAEAPASQEPAAGQQGVDETPIRPALPERPPHGSPLKVWLEYYRARKRIDRKYTYAQLEIESGYSAGYLRIETSKFQKKVRRRQPKRIHNKRANKN